MTVSLRDGGPIAVIEDGGSLNEDVLMTFCWLPTKQVLHSLQVMWWAGSWLLWQGTSTVGPGMGGRASVLGVDAADGRRAQTPLCVPLLLRTPIAVKEYPHLAFCKPATGYMWALS